MKTDFRSKKEKHLPTPVLDTSTAPPPPLSFPDRENHTHLTLGKGWFLGEFLDLQLAALSWRTGFKWRITACALMTFKLYLPVGLTITLLHVQPTLPVLRESLWHFQQLQRSPAKTTQLHPDKPSWFLWELSEHLRIPWVEQKINVAKHGYKEQEDNLYPQRNIREPREERGDNPRVAWP